MDSSKLGLRPQQKKVLDFLAQHPNTVVTNGEIMAHLYGSAPQAESPDSAIVKVTVCNLRSIMAKAGCADTIQTAWGRGYRYSTAEQEKLP